MLIKIETFSNKIDLYVMLFEILLSNYIHCTAYKIDLYVMLFEILLLNYIHCTAYKSLYYEQVITKFKKITASTEIYIRASYVNGKM